MVEPLVLQSDCTLEQRRLFIATASNEIERLAVSACREVVIDCSQIDTVDQVLLGTLTVVARNAQRHGLRLVLSLPSVRLRHDLTAAGLRSLFDW